MLTYAIPASGVALSADGRYAAVQSVTSTDQATAIYDLANNKRVVDAPGRPIGMSWNGRYLVTQTDTETEVIDWRTGLIIWHSQPSTTTVAQVQVAARPHSDDLALNISNQHGQPYRSAQLWLIANAHPKLIAPNVLFGVI